MVRTNSHCTSKGRLVEIQDRKSTRLNSSHSQISYAVFCLEKKNVSMSFQSGLSDWSFFLSSREDVILTTSYGSSTPDLLFKSHSSTIDTIPSSPIFNPSL